MPKDVELIDLTRPMTRQTIVDLSGRFALENPAYQEVGVTLLSSWDTDNEQVNQWVLNDHFGTHLDAPIHAFEEGATVDRIDISRLFGEAVVVDCTFACGRGLTSEDLDEACGAVQPGDILLIHSGDAPASAEEYVTAQTHMTADGAQWLVDRGVTCVGVEPWSFEHMYDGLEVHRWSDKSTPQPTWPAHQICLRNDVYILEGLCNLARIVGRRVGFCAMPLAVPGSSGSPVRAIAWVERS